MALNNFPLATPAAGSVTEAITATASGNQATGVQITTRYNRVSVCATNGDSVTLPPALVDEMIVIGNDGAANLAVFPAVGEKIGSGAANASFTVTAAKTAFFIGTGTPGKWAVVLSA